MTVLLPPEDGLADRVRTRVPEAIVMGYGAESDLADVTFYCLPYMGDRTSRELVRRLPRLSVVQSLSSGVDDVADLVPAGVTLCNGRGLHHEDSTAELAVALILASLRRLPQFVRQQAERSWGHVRTESLDGKRVLVVGYGAIGRAVQLRLAPFGARVTRVSRTARPGELPLTELRELARSADVLVVCVALNPQTAGLVGGDVLAALPDGALVVNVARGPVVDAGALTRELASGRLRAALDVTDPEPLPPDRPEWALPGVLLTPHVGGDTTAFAARAGDFLAAQVERHLRGEPLANVVLGPAS